MHEKAVIEAALRLIELGGSSREIAAEVGVPDRTIRMWRAGRLPREERSRSRSRPPRARITPARLVRLPARLVPRRRVDRGLALPLFVLRVSLDERYPMIIEAAGEAMATVHPESAVCRSRRTGCIVVANCWKH